MRFSIASVLALVTLVAKRTSGLEPLPINADDFDEPDWEAILEIAFPTWATPANGCPRLDAIGGDLLPEYSKYPTPEPDKFNPCYYTKAFAGLDPSLGGYPTPIDTHYPYEFAAPFFGQPGDGSVHHCPPDAPSDTDVGACPKLGQCQGVKDCAVISDEYGIGHIPPFVALAAIKNEYNEKQEGGEDICDDWFNYVSGCNIKKNVLDELVYKYFGDGDTIKFQPPILIDGVPSSTYYRLEYGGLDCEDDNCRGPHYCSKEVADAGIIWGDFCPYVHTGEKSGLYRHPHLALAALELWIANQCNPSECPSTWLDSPNAEGYAARDEMTTSITWSEMDDNEDPMAQPILPYTWPNSGDGIYPGLELYGGKPFKPAPGLYVNEVLAATGGAPSPTPAGKGKKGAAKKKLSKKHTKKRRL